MRVLAVDVALDEAVAELRSGRPVVVPTDTVYGVAALADDEGAVGELYRLKARPERIAIAVLVADIVQAEEWVRLGTGGRALATAFWPGPLTIVGESRRPLAVGAADGTLGVRCPAVAFVRELAGMVGPLATTSANRHGRSTAATAEAAAQSLLAEALLVVDGGRCDGMASTVVRADPDLVVLREGPLRFEDLARAVGGPDEADP